MMNEEKCVLVFDICSPYSKYNWNLNFVEDASTAILSDLISNNYEKEYEALIKKIIGILNDKKDIYKFNIY